MNNLSHLVYRIILKDEFDSLNGEPTYEGGNLDRASGFIHLSTRDQLIETARLYFSGKDILIFEFEASSFGDSLQWEPVAQRDHAMFPHLYSSSLDLSRALRVLERIDQLQ